MKKTVIVKVILCIALTLSLTSIFAMGIFAYATDYPGVEEQTIEDSSSAETEVNLQQIEKPVPPGPTPTPTPEPTPAYDSSGVSSQTGDQASIMFIIAICIAVVSLMISLLGINTHRELKRSIAALRDETNFRFEEEHSLMRELLLEVRGKKKEDASKK